MYGNRDNPYPGGPKNESRCAVSEKRNVIGGWLHHHPLSFQSIRGFAFHGFRCPTVLIRMPHIIVVPTAAENTAYNLDAPSSWLNLR